MSDETNDTNEHTSPTNDELADKQPIDAEKPKKKTHASENKNTAIDSTISKRETLEIKTPELVDREEEIITADVKTFEYAQSLPKEYVTISEHEKQESAKKLDYLIKDIDKSIKLYEGRGKKNKRPALIFKVLTTGLSSVVTILLGLRVTNAVAVTVMNNLALAISALMTVVTAWNAFYDYTELWVQYSKTVEELSLLKKDIEYLQAGNDNITVYEITYLKKRYDQILVESVNLMVKVRSEDTVKSSSKSK